MKLVISGASGLIGRALLEKLKGHELCVLVRARHHSALQPGVREILWDAKNQGEWSGEINGADAVIHLSGEPIAGKRWSAAQKKKLSDSRLESTGAIVKAIAASPQKPKVLISASAIGIYGPGDTALLDENSQKGQGFLADLCYQWEAAALPAKGAGVRTVLLRTGIVLARDGGAMAKMLPPFRLGLGGPLGSGKQIMSWIHIEDEVAAILECLKNSKIEGPVNLTAPRAVPMKEFAKTLGRVLRRPAVMPVPGLVLKLLLGEMSELLLTGQNVFPRKLIDAGFTFHYPELEPALIGLNLS